MIVHKYKLPNGNTLLWLGNQPIYGCENVLVLAGGNVLFLMYIYIKFHPSLLNGRGEGKPDEIV
jgi:hypothetical protein